MQVDVYSFGVIMWEVASHEQPARGRMRNLRVPQECPAEVDALINRCLSEDPENRPTAKEAYGTLKQWRDRQAQFLSQKRASMEKQAQLERDSREGPTSNRTESSAILSGDLGSGNLGTSNESAMSTQ